MIYNQNTSVAKMGGGQSPAEMRGPTSGLAGQSSQYGLDIWSGTPRMGMLITGRKGFVNRSNTNVNQSAANFNPYMGHVSFLKHPNVNYGPLEDPTFIDPGVRGLNKYADSFGTPNYIVKIADPLGRSTTDPSKETRYKDFGGEISLIQLQQTMMEIKNRSEIESTAAYNRNLPPNAKISGVSSVEDIMSRVLPDVMDEAKKTIIRPTRVPLPQAGYPNVMSGSYYNMVTGKIEGRQQGITERAFGKKMMQTPPELIEDFIEENMSWKKNLKFGPDYKESPDTKDKTKETIKTMEESGKLVTTDIGDNAFTKDKEFDKSAGEAEAKQATLQEKMKNLKKKGYLLGL